jgi:DNA helicase-2/ATP-dependent DNA helicase PcrA
MAKGDLLAGLNPAQREAVTHIEGPLLVLAAAGSGKTRVITRRVAHLMDQGVHAGNILAITFTNKAAGEMRQRVQQLVPKSRVWVSTFHSLGARLLREYGGQLGIDKGFTIYDQADRAKLVKTAIEDVGLEANRFSPESVVGEISKAKNLLLSPDMYSREKAKDFFRLAVAKVYPIYEKRLRDAHAMDFDDLLYWPALSLKNNREFRRELDSRFRFVLIDEYQDTNLAQYEIARQLSVDHPHLCVVGDPDQSIYSFRGSDIRNILDFERDFPSARVLTLGTNYRSTKSILTAAGALIAQNKMRKPKDLVTENATGNPVSVLTFETGNDEAAGVARRIIDAVKAGGRSYRDFAILLRINALTRALETAFVQQRVPFQIVKGLAFFDRKENRDVVAYLRLIVNPRDNISFLRAVNEPARGIGKVTLDRLTQYAESNEMSLLAACSRLDFIPDIKGKGATGLRLFAQMMDELGELDQAQPDEVIRQVLDRSGYRKMLKDSRDPDDMARLENIEELITAAKQFAEEDSSRTVGDFLENITLAGDIDGWDDKQNCVSIMTLHSAKGLEFPVVYLVAMEQGILPHERSLGNDKDLEEERRLAFVGMTRAMEELYLCHSTLRDFRGQTLYAVPSMFLDDIPPTALQTVDMSSSSHRAAMAEHWRGGGAAAKAGWSEAGYPHIPRQVPPRRGANSGEGSSFAEGMIVSHADYGPGKVMEVSGQGSTRRVKVRFGRAGVKTFAGVKIGLEVVG